MFHYRYAKKNSWIFLGNVNQALSSMVEQLKSMPNLPNECSRENHTLLANRCSIKVKQESELTKLDTKIIHVKIFTNEPINTAVKLIKN